MAPTNTSFRLGPWVSALQVVVVISYARVAREYGGAVSTFWTNSGSNLCRVPLSLILLPLKVNSAALYTTVAEIKYKRCRDRGVSMSTFRKRSRHREVLLPNAEVRSEPPQP